MSIKGKPETGNLKQRLLLAFELEFDVPGHGHKNCDKLVGFFEQPIQAFRTDRAVIAHQFKPEHRFIGFLSALVNFGDEFSF